MELLERIVLSIFGKEKKKNVIKENIYFKLNILKTNRG
jgi:hypothetical protein